MKQRGSPTLRVGLLLLFLLSRAGAGHSSGAKGNGKQRFTSLIEQNHHARSTFAWEHCNPKRPVDSDSFSVDNNADPVGEMGDIDDVAINRQPALVRFDYTTSGRGPHEWDYKYIDGNLNPHSARFAGVMYMDPDSKFGTGCGGYDLTGMHVVRWKARSLGHDAIVEFGAGGVKWMWQPGGVKVDPPYPDSLPSMSFGVKRLTGKWKEFEFRLPNYPEAYFSRVINVFNWTLSWKANHVKIDKNGNGPSNPRTFKIELKDICYSTK
ncbi:MAG TPA: hypothetical protein VI756_25245 [Blastocatellia bacterium]